MLEPEQTMVMKTKNHSLNLTELGFWEEINQNKFSKYPWILAKLRGWRRKGDRTSRTISKLKVGVNNGGDNINEVCKKTLTKKNVINSDFIFFLYKIS